VVRRVSWRSWGSWAWWFWSVKLGSREVRVRIKSGSDAFLPEVGKVRETREGFPGPVHFLRPILVPIVQAKNQSAAVLAMRISQLIALPPVVSFFLFVLCLCPRLRTRVCRLGLLRGLRVLGSR
jgi:hypothetical protein